MSGISEGGIYSGIGRGIEQATSNILNLYGLKQRFDLQQQGQAIDKQHADNATKRLQLKIASLAEMEFDEWHKRTRDTATPRVRAPGSGVNLRMPGSYDTNLNYLEGAEALSPDSHKGQ